MDHRTNASFPMEREVKKKEFPFKGYVIGFMRKPIENDKHEIQSDEVSF